MSGLEIAGLVAGIVGASARAMTAGKQLSETNFCKHIEKKRAGETVSIDKWVCTVGDGDAWVDKKGTLCASSRGYGAAGAGYSIKKK